MPKPFTYQAAKDLDMTGWRERKQQLVLEAGSYSEAFQKLKVELEGVRIIDVVDGAVSYQGDVTRYTFDVTVLEGVA